MLKHSKHKVSGERTAGVGGTQKSFNHLIILHAANVTVIEDSRTGYLVTFQAEHFISVSRTK